MHSGACCLIRIAKEVTFVDDNVADVDADTDGASASMTACASPESPKDENRGPEVCDVRCGSFAIGAGPTVGQATSALPRRRPRCCIPANDAKDQ